MNPRLRRAKRKKESPTDMCLFGNLFDFNGDGRTDLLEEMLGLEILSELEEDEDDDEEDA